VGDEVHQLGHGGRLDPPAGAGHRAPAQHRPQAVFLLFLKKRNINDLFVLINEYKMKRHLFVDDIVVLTSHVSG
jgi:hypothetical protein